MEKGYTDGRNDKYRGQNGTNSEHVNGKVKAWEPKNSTITATSTETPKNSQVSSTNGAAVIEIDRKTGKRIMRAPSIRQRILKGGKWKIITVPGAIISRINGSDSKNTKAAPPESSQVEMARHSDDQNFSFEELSEDRIEVMERRAEERRRRAEKATVDEGSNTDHNNNDKPFPVAEDKGEKMKEGQGMMKFVVYPRVQPIKYEDNLRLEGEFVDKPKPKEWVKGEMAEKVIREDTLRMEGSFYDTTTNREQFKSLEIMGKAKPVKHSDNLHPEGKFYGVKEKMPDVKPVERAQPIMQSDNLKTEGQLFCEKDKMPVYKLERIVPIKYEDHLKPEGEFFDKPKITEWLKGERADKIVHEDNLHMEGAFYASTVNREMFQPCERVDISAIRPVDNLKQNGSFEGITMAQEEFRYYTKGERAETVVHKDTLKLEGQFLGKREKMPEYRAERTTPIKYKDEFVTEGPFYGEKGKMPFHTPMKNEPIRQTDNLKLEGKFLGVREKMPEVKPERSLPIKQKDNLKLEGAFHDRPKSRNEGELYLESSSGENKLTRPSQLPIWRGDRYGIKRHQTTLKLEGDQYFSTSRNTSPSPQPRSIPIRPHDNLQLQGELNFDSLASSPFRRCTTPLVGDRASVRRHEDNLKLDGEFYGFSRPGPFPGLGMSPGHLQRQAKERRSLRIPSGRKNISQITLGDNLNSNAAGDLFRTTYSSSQAYRYSRRDGGTAAGTYHGNDGKEVSTSNVNGESLRAAVVRHSDNLTVGEGSMFLETTTKSHQRAILLEPDNSSKDGPNLSQPSSNQPKVLPEGKVTTNGKLDMKTTEPVPKKLDNGYSSKTLENSTGAMNGGVEAKQKILEPTMMGEKSQLYGKIVTNGLNQSQSSETPKPELITSPNRLNDRSTHSLFNDQKQATANNNGTSENKVTSGLNATKSTTSERRNGVTRTRTISGTHERILPSSEITNGFSTTTRENGMSSLQPTSSFRESRSSAPTSFHRRSNSSGCILRRRREKLQNETVGSTLRSGSPDSALFATVPSPSLSSQQRFTSSSSSYGSHCALHQSMATSQNDATNVLSWRAQKIQRPDNLTVGVGAFDSLTSSRSSFRRHKIDPQDRVVPVRAAQRSNISLG